MASQHTYELDIKWTGKTEDLLNYNRSFLVSADGKMDVFGSADVYSRGDPTKWNPEEMFIASIASCHMLWYLYFCANAKIIVTEYRDRPKGILTIDPKGKSKFVEVTLNPQVIITEPHRIQDAIALQQRAHDNCYMINSINFEVKLNINVTHL